MTVDVPGAPLTLRSERHRSARGEHVVEWSYADPERPGTDARRRGTTRVRATTRADAWARAQLDAAWAFKRQVDEDWIPGEPLVPKRWTPEEAWSALVTHLSGGAAEVTETETGDLLVEEDGERTVYHFDRTEWAAYLSPPEGWVSRGTYVVPAAVPADPSGLSVGVTDLLGELGATREIVVLVDGRLTGLRPRY